MTTLLNEESRIVTSLDILLILILEIAGYLAVHRAGLLRGYETSIIGAVRDLMMFVPLMSS